MKITLSRKQWESMGKQAGWMKVAVQVPPNVQYDSEDARHLDLSIRHLVDFSVRGSLDANPSEAVKKLAQQANGVKQEIMKMPDGKDKYKLIELFNGNIRVTEPIPQIADPYKQPVRMT